MILFNNNFSENITKTLVGEYFSTITTKSSLNPMYCKGTAAASTTMAFATNSTLVGELIENTTITGIVAAMESQSVYDPKNFQIVTEKFIKVLDKIYTKIWNESFTEDGIYAPKALASLYSAFVSNNVSKTNIGALSGTGATSIIAAPEEMKLKNFVARCITAGILTEEDRLVDDDQIFISQPQGTISSIIDVTTKIITFNSNSVIDIKDFSAKEGDYLYGKKLYLFFTPFISNASTMNPTTVNTGSTQLEPVSSSFTQNLNGLYGTAADCYSPFGFFKPKTSSSKFGASLPMPTHLYWSIGTPDDKEIAFLEGTEPPELIFDHLDKVTHIDNFQLKVKYGPIQFK